MLPEAELSWEQAVAQCCVGALVRSGTWGAGVRVDRKAEHHCCPPGSTASARLPVLEFTWEFREACWAEGSCWAGAREQRVTARAFARWQRLLPGLRLWVSGPWGSKPPIVPVALLGTRRAHRGRAGSSARLCVLP